MAQQTAVDWLVKELNLEEFIATIEFAKEKEKEQMRKIWMDFFNDSYHYEVEFMELFDKYYKETYEKDNP